MDAKVIPFPSPRRNERRRLDRSGSAAPQPAPRAAWDEPFAQLSLELRPLPMFGSAFPEDVAERILGRCTRVVIEALAGMGAALELAGTTAHPVIEARFEGEDAPARSARGALAVSAAVRDVQRVGERAFAVRAGLAAGWTGTPHRGARVGFGAAAGLAGRLRELAAPGQLLLGGDGWDRLEADLETRAAPEAVASFTVRVLRGVREGTPGV